MQYFQSDLLGKQFNSKPVGQAVIVQGVMCEPIPQYPSHFHIKILVVHIDGAKKGEIETITLPSNHWTMVV